MPPIGITDSVDFEDKVKETIRTKQTLSSALIGGARFFSTPPFSSFPFSMKNYTPHVVIAFTKKSSQPQSLRLRGKL